MSWISRYIAYLCSFLGLMAVFIGCQSTQITSSIRGGTKPPDTVQSVKEARFQTAVMGLSFDTGLVVVEPHPQRSNTKLGKDFYMQGLEALSRNRVIEALSLFNKSVHQDPNLAASYNS